MPMKYLLLTIAVLSLLVGCAPAEPVTPAAQPAEVLEPQMPEEAMEEPEMEEQEMDDSETMASEAALHEVTIKGFAYHPSVITVKVGDTVRWTNEDRARHDAYGDGWKTELLSQGDSGEYTFTEPGEYDYICSIHPSMKGKVVVVE